MTKIVRWWQRFSFWTKLKGVFASIGIGSEVALFIGDSHEGYKWLVAGATLIVILITHLVEDKDGDGQVDPL